ncbi:hypothetical protein ACLOJK_015294, partial [Asimina triloba]
MMQIVRNYSQMRAGGHGESEVKGRIWRSGQMYDGYLAGCSLKTSLPPPPRPRAGASRLLQKSSPGSRSSRRSGHQHHEVASERKMMRRRNRGDREVVRRALSPRLARSVHPASASASAM